MKNKFFIGIFATIAVIILVMFYQSDQQAQDQANAINSEQTTMTQQQNNNNQSANITHKQILPSQPEIDYSNNEYDDDEASHQADAQAKISPEEAIDLMKKNLAEGDDRKPEIRAYHAVEPPTQEELDEPELYAQYEARQEKKLIASYLNQVKRLPELIATIEQAEQSGQYTDDEIDEAKQALAELEKLNDQINTDPTLSDILSEQE